MTAPRPIRRASLFMRGVMFDPQSSTTTPIDTTEESDCTTPAGHARLRVLRGIFDFDKPKRPRG
ncbi:MAG TPA: hypothetical protein VGR19_11825 [Allosphingosinicella sp.]|nr:hypothetical protein [Allosphingosinicella sp.]